MKKLITPHITEKSYRTITEKNDQPNTYTFKVNPGLNKHDVRRMIEKDFKVTVLNVRITNIPGKVRRFKGIVGHTKPIKKAIVQLKKGDRIADFDNVQTAEADKE
jgi:large subunit ribosomal protein L23